MDTTMQDYEIDAYLGVAEATPDQRQALARALDRVTARFPEEGDPDATTAGSAAAQVILGDDTLTDISARWQCARVIEREAWAALVGAMIAAAVTGTFEAHVAETAGVTRRTVRKALGKH
jgi:hypothetical protein